MYTERQLTADGFELQFGTNHLGHFALTGLLLDRMVDVEGSRVVTVGSLGHWAPFPVDFDDVRARGRYNRFAAYSRSKLANLLFAYELHRRLVAAGAATASLAAHPGGSDTDLVRHVPFSDFMHRRMAPLAQSAAMGALPTLRAATDPTATGGQYYGPDRLLETRGHPIVVRSSRRSQDRALQGLLWARSEELTGVRPLAGRR
jgi:NAD(P)-dependent dehydrogenase (short-subunit alcohol dehydrogenase family)